MLPITGCRKWFTFTLISPESCLSQLQLVYVTFFRHPSSWEIAMRCCVYWVYSLFQKVVVIFVLSDQPWSLSDLAYDLVKNVMHLSYQTAFPLGIYIHGCFSHDNNIADAPNTSSSLSVEIQRYEPQEKSLRAFIAVNRDTGVKQHQKNKKLLSEIESSCSSENSLQYRHRQLISFPYSFSGCTLFHPNSSQSKSKLSNISDRTIRDHWYHHRKHEVFIFSVVWQRLQLYHDKGWNGCSSKVNLWGIYWLSTL